MPLTLALLAGGIVLLLVGGRALVEGASDLARSAGIPPLVVGMTIVAFGTSAPELSVNLAGALTGRGEISFGNVVGSNLANLGLILGIAALVRPLTIESQVIVREIPIMLLATAAVVVMSLDAPLRDAPAVLDRSDGLVLLLFFSVFLYAMWSTIREGAADPIVRRSVASVEESTPRLRISVLWMIFGLGGLVVGGELTVDSAARFAVALGIPPAVIAFSVVAVGTSLPELVTSVTAARAGESDLAVGNVVGSNIFNLLFVMGLTAMARPVDVPRGGIEDLIVLVVVSLLLLPVSVSHFRRIVRAEGAVLLALWMAYTTWRVVGPI